MGSLSNLYISQSYQSLIHFGNNSSASATLVEIQDGVGNGLGVYLNTTGSISASNTITTNNLVVNTKTELTGAFDLNTYFTASTAPLLNSFQPYFANAVYVTGSFPGDGGYPPSLNDIQVGWLCNGINVTNGVVTSISQSAGGTYFVIGGQFPQPAQSYIFTGQSSPTAKITGSLAISENLIVSGTFDIEGKVVVNDNVRINGNLEVSGSTKLTGSLEVSNNLIVGNDITASNVRVNGTLTAYEVHTIIESSSIIFSSGSNILGDSILDIQTLNGTVIISGSEQVTGSLNVSNNISSSTISGIGNVTTYSASVDQRLSSLQVASASLQLFSASVTSSLVSIYQTTASLNTFSASTNTSLANLNSTTESLNNSVSLLNDFSASAIITASALVNTITFTKGDLSTFDLTLAGVTFDSGSYVTTSSFNAYTSSTNIRLNNLESTTASLNTSVSSLNSFSSSQLTQNATLAQVTASLISKTGSYSTTGSNVFTGSQVFSGSVRGNVITLSVSSNTASMDLSLGNFFTLTLPTSSVTYLNPTNIRPGETVQLLVKQQSVTGSLNYPNTILFATGSDYSASVNANAQDILSFVTFDTSSIYAVSIKNLV